MPEQQRDDRLERLAVRFVQLASAGEPLQPTLTEEFGWSESTLRRRLADLRRQGMVRSYGEHRAEARAAAEGRSAMPAPEECEAPAEERRTRGQDRQGEYAEARGVQIKTLEELLVACEADTERFDVTNFIVNKWDTVSKGPDDLPIVTPNWQVKAWFGLKKPRLALQGLWEQLLESVRGKFVNDVEPATPCRSGHMLEIGLFDLHLGALSWSEETGEDWDLRVASQVFQDAIEQLAEDALRYGGIDQIVYPIGNDFFHADTKDGTTTSGTRLDMDTRWAKMFEVGVKLQRWAINRLRELAPVRVVVVPGNHDEKSSYALGALLKVAFEDAPDVHVDNSALMRKYFSWGQTLLGFTHGKHEAFDKLPMLMAAEAREEWGRTRYREFHVGHFHHRRGQRYLHEYTDIEGVLVRILPSLAATDAWHKLKGWVGAVKAAEAYVYDKQRGLIGTLHAQRLPVAQEG